MDIVPFRSKPPGRIRTDVLTVNWVLVAFFVFGLVVILLVWWNRSTVALLWSFASGSVGFIIGFIFGFPRSVTVPAGLGGTTTAVSKTTTSTTGQAPAPAPVDSSSAARLAVNTNLEQVSDWITKTIVGVGLVELKQMPPRFSRLAVYAGRTLGRPYTGSSADEAAAALIAYFAVLGFMSGYLVTRMYFQVAFVRGDRALGDAAQVLQGAALSIASFAMQGSTTSDVSPTITAAAKQLTGMSLDAAHERGISSAAIAKADLVMGSADRALAAYSDAIVKDPLNPRLRLEYATTLERVGRPRPQIITALRDAISIESQRPNPDVRRSIYEFLTYLLLYEEPEGYADAINYGTHYTTDPTNLQSAIVWVNLAAAYGQKAHRYDDQHPNGANDAARIEIRNASFNAAKQAISLDPSWRKFLASLMEPSNPAENDLVPFAKDEKFRDLLGLPPIKGG